MQGGLYVRPFCVVIITQGGGVAAPIASQVLGEVLPYLDVIKSEEEQTNSVTVPNVTGMELSEAKKVLKNINLEYDVQNNNEANNIENPVIINQLPKQGITVQEGTKIILYVD